MRNQRWPDRVEEILGGDQAAVLAQPTPAHGVTLVPVTNFALQDREAGTVAINSSVGMWRKLARIEGDPRVALAFHTREHGFSRRPEFVLVQGTADVPCTSEPEAWTETLGGSWERFGGRPREVGPLWERWLRYYHWRVNVEIRIERVIVWPDLSCAGRPEVFGAWLPPVPAGAQEPPTKGSGPRVDHVRAARRLAPLPNLLVGWCGADGFPTVVAAELCGAGASAIEIAVPVELLPAGGRRAGLLGHSFSRHVVGQRQRKHTGWMEAEPARGRILYAPHTEAGYHLPPSRIAFNLGAGYLTRRGVREGRREGFLEEGVRPPAPRDLDRLRKDIRRGQIARGGPSPEAQG